MKLTWSFLFAKVKIWLVWILSISIFRSKIQIKCLRTMNICLFIHLLNEKKSAWEYRILIKYKSINVQYLFVLFLTKKKTRQFPCCIYCSRRSNKPTKFINFRTFNSISSGKKRGSERNISQITIHDRSIYWKIKIRMKKKLKIVDVFVHIVTLIREFYLIELIHFQTIG